MQLVKKQSDTAYTAKSVEGFREGDLVEFAGDMNRIASIFENTVTFEKKFSADPVDAAIVPKKVLYSVEMDVTIRCDGDAETFSGVTLNPTSPAYLGRKLSGSRLVAATVEPSNALENPVSVILGKGALSGTISFAGGSDGTMEAVNAGVFIGEDNGPGQRTGIQAFLENDVASIIAVPGVTIPEVVVALISHCENTKNRFAVLDIPQELRKTNDIIEYRNMVDSTYAAMYHPWLEMYDAGAKRSAYFPPSGAMAGIYARTDIERGVHKAPANEVIRGCTGLSCAYNEGEQDILNPIGVNLIRSFTGRGIRVWAPAPSAPTACGSTSTSAACSSMWRSPSRPTPTGWSLSPTPALCGAV